MQAKTEGHLEFDVGSPGLGQQTMIEVRLQAKHTAFFTFHKETPNRNPMDPMGNEKAFQTLYGKKRICCYKRYRWIKSPCNAKKESAQISSWNLTENPNNIFFIKKK